MAFPIRAENIQRVFGYVGHNLALLALPVALASLALALAAALVEVAAAAVGMFSRTWSRGGNPGVNLSQARNIWIIQAIVAVGPPLGGLFFNVYMKTDWGISLFFLTPLALVAIPALRIREIALFHLAAIWLVITLSGAGRLALPSPHGRWRRIRTVPRPMARAPNSRAN